MVIEHLSAGIIPRYGEEDFKYLLLKYPQGHWGFPKGHQENNESDWETAQRELREETGINNVTRIGDFRKEINYQYNLNGSTHHKTVIYFGGSVQQQNVVLSDEHRDFSWDSPNETLKQITYENEQDLFKSWINFQSSRKENE